MRPCLYMSVTNKAAPRTSGESISGAVLSALAYAPPLPKANGAKRAQSAFWQKPAYLPFLAMASAAVFRSSHVQSAVGSAMPASVKASGRYTSPSVPQSFGRA